MSVWAPIIVGSVRHQLDESQATAWLNNSLDLSSDAGEALGNAATPTAQVARVTGAWTALGNFFRAANIRPTTARVYIDAMRAAYGTYWNPEAIAVPLFAASHGYITEAARVAYNATHTGGDSTRAQAAVRRQLTAGGAMRMPTNPELGNLSYPPDHSITDAGRPCPYGLGDWRCGIWDNGGFGLDFIVPPLVRSLMVARLIARQIQTVGVRRTVEAALSGGAQSIGPQGAVPPFSVADPPGFVRTGPDLGGFGGGVGGLGGATVAFTGGTPVPQSPAEGGDVLAPLARFIWSVPSGATRFQFALCRDFGMTLGCTVNGEVAAQPAGAGQVFFDSPVPIGDNNYWSVRAAAADGTTWSAWSTPRRVTSAAPVPSVAIAPPGGGGGGTPIGGGGGGTPGGGGGGSTAALEAPQIVTPAIGTEAPEGQLTFAWTVPVGATRYQFALCTDVALSNGCIYDSREVAVNTPTPGQAAITIGMAPGQYFWSVRAARQDLVGGWSPLAPVTMIKVVSASMGVPAPAPGPSPSPGPTPGPTPDVIPPPPIAAASVTGSGWLWLLLASGVGLWFWKNPMKSKSTKEHAR